ncbi:MULTISPECIES: hypothetical protein [Rhizobium]|uniref:Uncharacterized protein n=1 Tax=Rhizobium leguminosarum bv. viciae TaxID=387 RepID=A0A8G2IT91_RHILV|nr:hypothetical protein [Rhizobium leguminosarum]NKK11045.1 hypothetical protein [Rhizobium leguminosarum bv. viciae]NKK19432.1 hypothetical protein [Rhizobium leguminosarum bv. viciae]TBX85223.1 hypothetical protein E0H31_34940 [Rhizobium leguminosarum bv. viciae]TBZ08654.1 hypothetical protein E0H52_36020 [Rhizobium leguminosarum bv. viciae]
MLSSLLKNIRKTLTGVERSRKEDILPPKPHGQGGVDIAPHAPADTPSAPEADLPAFQFEPETPAETYFFRNSGETVVGGFDPVDTRSISFIEAQWQIDATDDPAAGDPAARAGGPSTSLSDLRNSVKKIRAQADRQRLLSPKSAMALAKLETGKAKLTESDVNALEYLLGRLQNNSGTAVHAALLADHLRRKP